MPLKLLMQLDAALTALGDYKRDLAEAPVLLDRVETSVRVFRGIRAQLAEAAPNLHEMKGVAAGLRQAGPITQQHIEIVKAAIRDEKVDPAVGKEIISTVSRAVLSLHEAAEDRARELNRLAGKIDGLYAAAKSALSEATAARTALDLAKEREREESEDDWSGRGTPNGQRPVKGGNGKGGKVVPLKKPSKQRSKKSKAEATPDETPAEVTVVTTSEAPDVT
jgi:hypothetical protein